MNLSEIAQSIGVLAGRPLGYEPISSAGFRLPTAAAAAPDRLIEAYVDL